MLLHGFPCPIPGECGKMHYSRKYFVPRYEEAASTSKNLPAEVESGRTQAGCGLVFSPTNWTRLTQSEATGLH